MVTYEVSKVRQLGRHLTIKITTLVYGLLLEQIVSYNLDVTRLQYLTNLIKKTLYVIIT